MKVAILIGTLLFWSGSSVGENIEETKLTESCQAHTSPTSVYRAVAEAIDSKHWEKLYACLAPNDRDAILNKTLSGLLLASAFDEALNKSLTPVLLRHGFKINGEKQWNTGEEDYKNVDNKQKLYGDLYSVAMQHDTENLPEDSKNPQLFDLVIEGDVAHGVVRQNPGKESVVYFKRTSSGWLISTKEE